VDLFVVIDVMGAGRVVGVFDSERAARHVIGDFPEYYKLYVCRLNALDPTIIEWARNDEQAEWLRRIVDGRSPLP
jgi:hypothetical protein